MQSVFSHRTNLFGFQRFRKFFISVGLCLLVQTGFAQTPATSAAESVLGQVEAVDVATRTLTIKTEGRVSLTVVLATRGTIVKVAPGETSLQNATPIAFDVITPGDRVMVRGGARNEGRKEIQPGCRSRPSGRRC